MKESWKCNFCNQIKQHTKEEIHLVHHMSGGASYACEKCLNDPKMEIRKMTNGGYYTK